MTADTIQTSAANSCIMWDLYMYGPLTHLRKWCGEGGITMTIHITVNALNLLIVQFRTESMLFIYFNKVGWNVGDGGTKDKQIAINSQPRMSESRFGFSVVWRHSCTYNSSRSLWNFISVVKIIVWYVCMKHSLLLWQRCDYYIDRHRIKTHADTCLPIAHINLHQLEEFNGSFLVWFVAW